MQAIQQNRTAGQSKLSALRLFIGVHFMASASIGALRQYVDVLRHFAQKFPRQLVHYCSLGCYGERRARRYLERCHYLILEQNWRSGREELDIVALQATTLIFVEVKTRLAKAQARFTAEESVHLEKQKNLRRVACAYRADHRRELKKFRVRSYRFDVIAVSVRTRCWGFMRRAMIVHHQNFLQGAYLEGRAPCVRD